MNTFGEEFFFLKRECDFYRNAPPKLRPYILPYHGYFKTAESFFLCVSRASPFIGTGREYLSKFSRLVTTLKILYEDLKLVHRDIRPQNIMIFQGEPVFIDFAYCEKVIYSELYKPGLATFREMLSYSDPALRDFIENVNLLMSNMNTTSHIQFFEKILELCQQQQHVDYLELIVQNFYSRMDLTGLKDFFKLLEEIFSFKFSLYREYRGTFWTASDNLLKLLGEKNFQFVSPRDDLESLVKSFLLLKDNSIFEVVNMTPRDSFVEMRQVWNKVATQSSPVKSLLEAARTLNYDLVAQLMNELSV